MLLNGSGLNGAPFAFYLYSLRCVYKILKSRYELFVRSSLYQVYLKAEEKRTGHQELSVEKVSTDSGFFFNRKKRKRTMLSGKCSGKCVFEMSGDSFQEG